MNTYFKVQIVYKLSLLPIPLIRSCYAENVEFCYLHHCLSEISRKINVKTETLRFLFFC